MTAPRSLRDIAHDIRTPLSVIQLTAETLIEREKDEEARKDLQTIVRQVEKITELANQLATPRGQRE